LTLTVSEAAKNSAVSIGEARAVLRRAEEDGLFEPRVAGVLHRYQMLRRPDRETDLPALLDSVRDGLEGEHRRLAAVRSYVLESNCRVSHGLAYLGDVDTAPCGLCDLCSGAPPISPEALTRPDWHHQCNAAEIREMAAMNGNEPDPVGVARALCQVSTPRSRPYRKHPAWGRLERAPYKDVLAEVEAVLR
jgi:hypothetical protein